jgi:hypothetical protein
MGLLSKIFGFDKKRIADETFLKDMEIENEHYEVIQMFRNKTKENNIKLSITDKEIVYISQSIFYYFPQVAKNRGERIDSNILFSIAESFMYKYQMTGNDFYLKQLQYELDKYMNEGLRNDYVEGSKKWAY